MPNYENTGESHFEIATRQTIERDITEAYEAGDSNLVNIKLEVWPYGRFRVLEHLVEVDEREAA